VQPRVPSEIRLPLLLGLAVRFGLLLGLCAVENVDPSEWALLPSSRRFSASRAAFIAAWILASISASCLTFSSCRPEHSSPHNAAKPH
jgi:hypothetical protein